MSLCCRRYLYEKFPHFWISFITIFLTTQITSLKIIFPPFFIYVPIFCCIFQKGDKIGNSHSFHSHLDFLPIMNHRGQHLTHYEISTKFLTIYPPYDPPSTHILDESNSLCLFIQSIRHPISFTLSSRKNPSSSAK